MTTPPAPAAGTRRGDRRPVAAVLAGVLLGTLLAACAGSPSTGPGRPAPSPDAGATDAGSSGDAGSAGRAPNAHPASAGPLPDDVLAGVAVEIRQGRARWGDREVQLRVRNEGSTPVTVRSAALTVPTVAGSATSDPSWTRAVPAGRYRDASVPLGAPVCDRAGPASGRVTLDLADDAGRTARVTRPAADPQGHLERIHGEDCAAEAVGRGLRMEPLGPLEVEDRAGELVAVVRLALTPVPGGPAVTVDRVDGTVLLAPLDGSAWAGPAGPVTAATTLTLPGRATRCDPHAVAEDKRGSFLGVHATVDGVEQHVFYLWLGAERRGQLHRYIGRACGWPG